MTADYINPFLTATSSVFQQMLNLQLTRGKPFLRKAFDSQFEITGIIGLSGRATGTVAFSLPRKMALTITEIMLGERPDTIDAQVVDVVGELTNMIAGAAKAQLAALELSLGLPTVVIGLSACVAFPTRAVPISIPFTCELGALVVEVGIAAEKTPLPAAPLQELAAATSA